MRTRVAGREGCQTRFDELGLRTYGGASYAIHRLIVDAYCLQHPEAYCRSAKSYAAHLTGLCCGVEHGGDPKIYRATQQLLNGIVPIERPEPPSFRGKITIADLLLTCGLEEHIRTSRAWARDVWDAYSAQRGIARQWIEAALGVSK